MAGTALRGAITRLLNPTAEAGEILHDMGVTVMDAEGKMRPLVDIVGQLEGGRPHSGRRNDYSSDSARVPRCLHLISSRAAAPFRNSERRWTIPGARRKA